jgi:hypothetical protein
LMKRLMLLVGMPVILASSPCDTSGMDVSLALRTSVNVARTSRACWDLFFFFVVRALATLDMIHLWVILVPDSQDGDNVAATR